MFEGLGIIAKFLYIIAVIVIAHGGWQVRSGNADMGKMSIVGGLLLGLAVVIADALSGGRDANHHPRQMSKAVINTHAGDDKRGRLPHRLCRVHKNSSRTPRHPESSSAQ